MDLPKKHIKFDMILSRIILGSPLGIRSQIFAALATTPKFVANAFVRTNSAGYFELCYNIR